MDSAYDPSPAYPPLFPASSRLPHTCAEWCVCPIHGTPLIWWPAGNDHACQDVTCEYGHGGLRYPLLTLAARQRAQTLDRIMDEELPRYGEALKRLGD